MISEATPPLDPSSLSRRVIVMAGGILGLLFGIGIAVLVALVRSFREMARPKPVMDARPLAYSPWRGDPAGAVAPAGAGVPAYARPEASGPQPAYGPMTTTGNLSIDDTAFSHRAPTTAAPSSPTASVPIDGLRPSLDAVTGEQRRMQDRQAAADREGDITAAFGGERPPARPLATVAAGGAAPVPRRSLRDRVRAIAAERAGDPIVELSSDPDIARLQHDIAQAKQHIASIRARRHAR